MFIVNPLPMGHFHPFSMTLFCLDLTGGFNLSRPKAQGRRLALPLLPSINRGLGGEVSRLDPWPTFLDQRVDLGLCPGTGRMACLEGMEWYGRLKLHQHVYESP
jgi:hypothetical protein